VLKHSGQAPEDSHTPANQGQKTSTARLVTYKECPNKSARFNFVIKHTIYSKSADIFI